MVATLALAAILGPEHQPVKTGGLSPVQIARVARGAGFDGSRLVTAVAVALAESRGVPKAHHVGLRDDSYGLWQINVRGSLWPSRRRAFGIERKSDLFDPETNARAAFVVSGGGKSWKPWAVYTASRSANSYRRWVTLARKAASEVAN